MDIMSPSDHRKNLLSERIVRILRNITNINYVNGDKEITEKVIELLKGRELSLETYKAVNEFLDKMKTKDKNNTFIFEIHDTIGYFVRDASPERCGNIDDFLSLIKGLVDYINNSSPKQFLGFKDEPLFTHTATIAIGDGFNNSNKACGTHLANIEVVNGGSKSRCKPARKTTRKSKSKSKSKSKTYRRRRHSRIRKHKKYTSRRRR
jgi:hypothetical protein